MPALGVAYAPHCDRKANHEASALGQRDPAARHPPDFGSNQVGDHAEIVLNASPLNDGAVEVVLGEENGGDERSISTTVNPNGVDESLPLVTTLPPVKLICLTAMISRVLMLCLKDWHPSAGAQPFHDPVPASERSITPRAAIPSPPGPYA